MIDGDSLVMASPYFFLAFLYGYMVYTEFYIFDGNIAPYAVCIVRGGQIFKVT